MNASHIATPLADTVVPSPRTGAVAGSSMRRKRVLLLGAGFGTGNMGVGALAAGALTIVAQRFPRAEVLLLDYGREATVDRPQIGGRVVEVPLINLRFSWKPHLRNNIARLLLVAVIARWFGPKMRARLIGRNRWLALIDDCDLALAVSGGDSFSDIYGLGRFFYVTLPQWLILLLGKPLVLLPQTIGPFQRPMVRMMARSLLRRAQLVYTRDEGGVTEIGQITDHARFCPDMGFVLEPRAPVALDLDGLACERSSEDGPLVGLNVSGLLMIGGYSGSNMFGLGVDYATLVERLIALFIERRQARVLLVPHVFGAHDECDTAAIEEIYSRLCARYPGRLFRARGVYDQSEIKHVIGLCDMFVGARMHACIAALSQAVPTVGIAYSDKFAGVFDSVGAGAFVADPRRQSLSAIEELATRCFDERETLAAQLELAIPAVRARVLGLLDSVA
ncbi:polysaccharide pyruvyl transferase family protein [Rivibacter subsaxonicus]|uniref:Polysaccharide pyruvyl transferase WcaK-like protein n=1 Tax=Rivibacter subsaxonicus TaxID=457575 RepID=A0A4Q7VVU8_9BURK|nr:polysaccharide pyruvyl transferase family protein [Rivibacter subsaxonicus]RZU00781.1 polysaccharide pyruvyl transferase WcaK-like protein [Rivibacter subsaxonicus]